MRKEINLDLTSYNSYRVHSIAAIALFPESESDFLDIINQYDIQSLHVVGKGCNTIFAKKFYTECQPIVFVRENYSKIEQIEGNKLKVLSGTDLEELSVYAMEHSMSGLEYFYDIPGCVGGAITMNAGSCGVSFTDFLEEVKFLDCETGSIRIMNKKELNVAYRTSIFKSDQKFFILSCVLSLPIDRRDDIKKRMNEIKEKRMSKQPREYPNAGSVFIRPAETVYVGPMIEKLGLKGYRIGDAEVSQKHAGFIVNTGNASGSDIVELIDHIKCKVKKEYGIELQTEQRILS